MSCSKQVLTQSTKRFRVNNLQTTMGSHRFDSDILHKAHHPVGFFCYDLTIYITEENI